MIFRGKGKRISPDEKESYHKEVDVYRQPNAWADTEFSIEWVRKTLKPAVKTDNDEEFILFCDNLAAQTSELFLAEVKSINGLVWFGVSGATDIWQPVDCGIGQILKRTVANIQEEWLEDDDNVDLWLGNTERKLDVKARRILITHWVGEAYQRLMSDEYAQTRWRSFEKTGCLITADGSEDHKINP